MTVTFASYIRILWYFHMSMPQSVSMSACHVTAQDDLRLPRYDILSGRVSRNMLYLLIGVSKCENTHGNCTFRPWRCQNGPGMQIPTSETSWAPSESLLFQYNTWSRLQKHAKVLQNTQFVPVTTWLTHDIYPIFVTLCHFMSLYVAHTPPPRVGRKHLRRA